jgi:hypothetical protein
MLWHCSIFSQRNEGRREAPTLISLGFQITTITDQTSHKKKIESFAGDDVAIS